MVNKSDRHAIPIPIVHLERAFDDGDEITVASRPSRRLRTTGCVLKQRTLALRPNRNRDQDDSLMI
jgi:hypothetical protein